MASTLSVKVDAQVADFSRNLDQAGRKWEKFGRDLNQGSRALTQSFGMTSGALGNLARSFDVAGNAAGIFAGIDGLAGIASSLAVGGPVLAGLAALTLALSLSGNAAEDSKKRMEDFKALLEQTKFDNLKASTVSLQQQFDRVSASLNKLRQRFAGSIDDKFSHWVVGLFTDLNELEQVQKDLAQQMLLTGEAFNKLAPDAAKKRVKDLADEMERLAKIAREMNQGAVLQAWRLHQPGFPGGINQAGAVSTIAATPIPQNMIQRLSPGLVNQSQDDVIKQLRDQFFELQVLELQFGKVDSTLESGFASIAPALASVLAPMLGLLFSSREAQAAASIGGAFGEGALASQGKGKWFGPLLGVLGGGLGALIGGAIGSLFGGQKKHVDNTADSLDRLARMADKVSESISNLPSIIKIAAYRFRATIPTPPKPPPLMPEGPEGQPTGPTGGSPTSGTGIHGRVLINYGPIYLSGVNDGETFVRRLGNAVLKSSARGGTMVLSTGLRAGF